MLARLFVATFCLLAALAAATPTWSEKALDPREPQIRTSEERAFIFGQMQLFLEAIAGLQDDLAKGDMAGVVAHAAPRGATEFAKVTKPAGLSEKETAAWKQFARATRLGFDAIAAKAGAGAGKDEILGQIGATMQACVACHQTYRIVVKDE
jgi:cytochrome c556